jgi:hypothetical protein
VFQIVAVVELINAIFPVPKLIVLTLLLVLENELVDNVKLCRSSVPNVSVVVKPRANDKLSCRAHEPPEPLKVNGLLMVMLPLVMVLAVVDVNVTAPVVFQTVPTIVLQLPATVNVGVVPVAKVTKPALTVISRQFNAPVIVTVYVAA